MSRKREVYSLFLVFKKSVEEKLNEQPRFISAVSKVLEQTDANTQVTDVKTIE
jgi:hypothetical protein